jgi:hypothetical protein
MHTLAETERETVLLRPRGTWYLRHFRSPPNGRNIDPGVTAGRSACTGTKDGKRAHGQALFAALRHAAQTPALVLGESMGGHANPASSLAMRGLLTWTDSVDNSRSPVDVRHEEREGEQSEGPPAARLAGWRGPPVTNVVPAAECGHGFLLVLVDLDRSAGSLLSAAVGRSASRCSRTS